MGSGQSKIIVKRGVGIINEALKEADLRCAHVNTEETLTDAKNVLSRQECSGDTSDPTSFMLVIYLKNEPVGFMSLDLNNEHCCYISYMCAKNTTTGGIGTLMAFLSVYIAKLDNKITVYSTGISRYGKKFTDYPRGDGTIVASQYIMIKKMGFSDAYKHTDGKKYDEKKMMSVMNLCGDSGETYLDLVYGNMIMYEKYKNDIMNKNTIKSLFPQR